MGKELVREALQDLVKQGVPSNTSLGLTVREHLALNTETYKLNKVTAGQPRRSMSVRSNLSLAAILIILIGLGTIMTVFLQLGASSGSATKSVTEPLNANPVTRTINGYTVNLYPSYAPEHWLVLAYTVTDPQGSNLGLFEVTENGLHVDYSDNMMGGKAVPKLVDTQGHNYPVIGVGPRFAWSQPTTDVEKTPISDVEAHQIEAQQSKAMPKLTTADVIIWDFDPLINTPKDASDNMHLEMTVYLPDAVLQSGSGAASSASGLLDAQEIGYKNTVRARFTFDFPVPSR